MTAVVKPYDRFLLTVLGVAMYQHKDSEGPELALKGGKYYFMKQTTPEVQSIQSGDEVWVVNDGVSTSYWRMPTSEIGANQDQAQASRFVLHKTSGSDGPEIRYGDRFQMATVVGGYWLGLSESRQVVRGWFDRVYAEEMWLQELGTHTLAPTDLIIERTYALLIEGTNFSNDGKMICRNFRGTKDGFEKWCAKMKESYSGKNMTPYENRDCTAINYPPAHIETEK